MRQNQWQQGAKNFLMNNLPVILLVFTVFVAGVVFGALSIRALGDSAKQDMITHLNTFFTGLLGASPDAQTSPDNSVWLNLKTAGIIWLLGISTIGMPLIPIIIFLRGFVIGFTVGFLVNELGFRGMIFALVSVLPQNLIIVPALIIAGMLAISFSMMILKSLITKRPIDFFSQFANYSVIMVLVCGVLLVASIIEGFATPALMKVIARIVLKS